MATLREVAEYAKVSTAVVSRVLNNKPGVWASEDTRRRIMEAARLLKYQPSASAKALSTGRTMQVAISTADASLQTGNPAQLWQLLGFTDAAAAHGYRVVLITSEAPTPSLEDFEGLVRSNACDGFCLFAEQLTPSIHGLLEHSGTPFVVLGDPGTTSVPQVDIDNYRYTYDSVRWLVEAGHQRIGLAEFADAPAGVDHPHLTKLRAGYFAAMRDFCGREEPAWAPTYRTRSAMERVEFVTGPDAPTAVIVAGLLDAVVWEAAFRSNGIRVPEDVALLCHIPTKESDYLEMGLAYHGHDLRAMGSQAGELLLEWIEQGQRSDRRLLIAPDPPKWRVPDGEVPVTAFVGAEPENIDIETLRSI
jgi:LacI family transcriptional regulator